MRVLIVTQYFWPEGFYLNDVVASMVSNGIEVDVLTGKPNYPEGKVFNGYTAWGCQQESWRGINILRVPLYPRGQKSAWRLAANYLSFVLSGSIFGLWLLRKRQYDVVFGYGVSPILQTIPAILLAKVKGCKVVSWVQDLWPDSLKATGYVRNQLALDAVKSLVSWIYRHTDLLLLQSQAFVAPVKQLAPTTPVAYQPNSVDAIFTQPPSEAVALPEIPALDTGFPVVFAGNVGAAQAVEVIVEAATRLADHPEIRFVVIGQGSRWEWMNEQVKARGLCNLHLPGRFPVNTMPGLLKKAGAVLVTLTDEPIFAQTIPNKIQAYMAVGRPILASLNGEGARVVAEAEAGLAVPAGDPDRLVDAVLEVFNMSSEQRAAMGASGRRYFMQHFEHEQLVKRMLHHFETLAVKERI
ncbi:glycosyltransferase family 4 protein [Herbaspirillum seropedicae]|uniref:glycosyltransferase family 4 protein n=1 Tax=Herbaspirillum seropedicae TaxID=964 RepID=UPI003F8D6C68